MCNLRNFALGRAVIVRRGDELLLRMSVYSPTAAEKRTSSIGREGSRGGMPTASPTRQKLLRYLTYSLQRRRRLPCADFVVKVGEEIAAVPAANTDAAHCFRSLQLERRLERPGTNALHATSTLPHADATHAAAAGGGRAASLARRRRFWATAANVNSNWAPRGPRNLRRPSRRMRFR
jgi:hypothetical protein